MDVSPEVIYVPPVIVATVNGYSIVPVVQESTSKALLPQELVLNPDLEFTIQMRSIKHFSVNDLASGTVRDRNRCLRTGEMHKGR